MDFRHGKDGRKVSVFLQRRSLLVMSGESRYSWTHGIAARHFDEVHSLMPGYREIHLEPCQLDQASQPGQTSQSGSTAHSIQSGISSQSSLSCNAGKSSAITATVIPRGNRMSLTFRKVRRKPCVCDCGKCASSSEPMSAILP